jgi:predicted enzyme related to lactoylglutathione lyase
MRRSGKSSVVGVRNRWPVVRRLLETYESRLWQPIAGVHVQLAPLICVRDVESSSRWYQRLLGCESGHGGIEYERLNSNGRLILQLHNWDVEHQHGRLGDPELRPYGNGVLLWFELEDYEAAARRAEEMNVEVVKPSHRSENLNWEFWLRDPDGYMIVLTSPLHPVPSTQSHDA